MNIQMPNVSLPSGINTNIQIGNAFNFSKLNQKLDDIAKKSETPAQQTMY